MWPAVRGLPDQLRRAAEREGDLPALECTAVVIAGMGGSAIAGDLAASLWSGRLAKPVVVVRSGELPGWVGADTCVLACSYSGETAETLTAYGAARDREARLVAATTGGTLGARAAADGVPVVPLEPGRQPRAAVGDALGTVLFVLARAGALEPSAGELRTAADLVEALLAADSGLVAGPGAASGEGPAELAALLTGRWPVVYAPAALGPVGRRWKTQLNENAKVTAFWEEIPELDHNAVEGLAGAAGERVIVGLAAPAAGPDAAARLAATLTLAAEQGWHTRTVHAPEAGLVAEGLWLLAYGDLVSLHVAARRGVDPSPVELIRRLKEALARAAAAP